MCVFSCPLVIAVAPFPKGDVAESMDEGYGDTLAEMKARAVGICMAGDNKEFTTMVRSDHTYLTDSLRDDDDDDDDILTDCGLYYV